MSLMAINTRDGVQLNPDALLGYLEFHSIPDLRIRKDDLKALWMREGLSMEFLPGEIRNCDAFRRATAAAQGEIRVHWCNGEYAARLLVREVKCDNEEIVRLLVREIVDSKNEILDYSIAGKITFYRSNGTVSTNCSWHLLSEYEYDKVLQQMVNTYDEFVNFHTRDTVRNLVNKVIRSANPVSIISHSQGKFIPKKNHRLMMCLKSLLATLRTYANGEECSLEMIPIVDTKDQRELVARRASVELTSELAEHLKEKKEVDVNTAQRLAGKAVELQERAKEYEKLVNVRLVVLRNQLKEFIGIVSVPQTEAGCAG
jgi:hypothetical protein